MVAPKKFGTGIHKAAIKKSYAPNLIEACELFTARAKNVTLTRHVTKTETIFNVRGGSTRLILDIKNQGITVSLACRIRI